MALENSTPTPPETTPPIQEAPPPAPPERKRISSTFVKSAPDDTAGTPLPPRGDNGQFQSPNPPVQPVTPPTPVHPEWMMEMATDLGFDPRDVAKLDSNSLGLAIRSAQKVAQPRQQQQAQAPPPPPEPEPEPEIDLGLTPEQMEDFGPDMIAVLTRVAKQNAIETRKLEQRLAGYEQREVARTQSQALRTIDEAVAALGPEYEGLLGKGPAHLVVHADAAAFRKRKYLIDTLQNQGLNYATASAAEIRDRLKQLVDEDFGPQVKKPARKPPNPPAVTREQWNQGGSPPPTQRTGGNALPERSGGSLEDRYQAATEEELADEKIRASLRRRKQPQT